jgi:UMP-CMP kinase
MPKLSFCPFSLFLFASSAAAYSNNLRRKSKKSASSNEKFQVVFVLGGPGAGKGTQCALLSEKLNWSHLSAGDLLRAERKSGSDLAELINAKISAGQIVPSSITVTLIQNAMEKIRAECGTTKFLIDGFPRSAENCTVWEEKMANSSEVEFVLFLHCPEDVMTGRLLERAKTSGRNDDNLETIRKRFKTFRVESMPIVDMYEKKGLVKTVVADRSVEDVYEEVQVLFKGI